MNLAIVVDLCRVILYIGFVIDIFVLFSTGLHVDEAACFYAQREAFWKVEEELSDSRDGFRLKFPDAQYNMVMRICRSEERILKVLQSRNPHLTKLSIGWDEGMRYLSAKFVFDGYYHY